MKNKVKNNIRITKCYFVEYVDKNGKEIDSDFCFGTKEDAKVLGEKLKRQNQNRSCANNIGTNVNYALGA